MVGGQDQPQRRGISSPGPVIPGGWSAESPVPDACATAGPYLMPARAKRAWRAMGRGGTIRSGTHGEPFATGLLDPNRSYRRHAARRARRRTASPPARRESRAAPTQLPGARHHSWRRARPGGGGTTASANALRAAASSGRGFGE
jgi:hypothetical protein